MPLRFIPDHSEEEKARWAHEAAAQLTRCGARLGPNFSALGLPQLMLIDRHDEGEVDLRHFQGRIALDCTLHSSPYAAFPSGPVRLTLCRWGPEPDQIGKITIGKGSHLSGASIISYCGVHIGENVGVAQAVIMDCDGHPSDRRLPDEPVHAAMGEVIIEDHAWIGHEAVILRGVRVGHHAVVGARSVVVRDVPPHSVVLGNPARVLRRYDPDAEPG